MRNLFLTATFQLKQHKISFITFHHDYDSEDGDEDDNVACDSDFNNNDCDDDESIACDRDII